MPQIVERFAISPARIAILRGLIAYRAELRNRGVTTGFQWLDGSFVEHKEAQVSAPPNDVDVVTFFVLPANTNEAAFVATNRDLFTPDFTKPTFRVDAYPFLLGQALTRAEVRQVAYWYSMWSHRRNRLWKGFVQVDIAAAGDEHASALLLQIENEGPTP